MLTNPEILLSSLVGMADGISGRMIKLNLQLLSTAQGQEIRLVPLTQSPNLSSYGQWCSWHGHPPSPVMPLAYVIQEPSMNNKDIPSSWAIPKISLPPKNPGQRQDKFFIIQQPP